MKRIFIALIFLIITNISNAQFTIDAKSGFGINGIFKFNESIDMIDFSSAFSYNFGVTFSQNIWKKGILTTDLLYFDKRNKVHWDMSVDIPDYFISFKYLSIPVYLQIAASKRFYINFGYVNNIVLNYKLGEYDTAKVNNYNGGLLLGFEYEILPKIRISINAQSDINPFANQLIEPVLPSETGFYYNYNFMFSISYRLFTKHKEN
jgi:hypothetical protein